MLETTSYETFTAPRVTGGRRNLAVVHPISQLGLSLQITDHRQLIRDIISGTSRSLYRIQENVAEKKAFEGLDFRAWEIEGEKIRASCPFILKSDISRFFYTIYTHSIPWAVLGKDRAKELLLTNRQQLLGHWSSKIDIALQRCQSRETFGIPVGPDTSRIIAELLLAGVEADPELCKAINGRPSCRLVDDLIIGFENEALARKALTTLRHTLWKFNLQLNEQKTGVQSANQPVRERWQHDLEKVTVTDADSPRQEKDIYRLTDLTLHLCLQANSGQPATWACRRILELANVTKNFEVILNALFRFSREFPVCTSSVAEFLVNHTDQVSTVAIRGRVLNWIRGMVHEHLGHRHDFEVAWALLVAGILQLRVDEQFFLSSEMPSSVTFAILGMLKERRLLNIPLSHWPWRATVKQQGIYGPYWLPFYESVRRRWTRDRSMIQAVNSDPFLARMLANNVTFLEDQAFDAASIDVSRRVFKPKKPGGARALARRTRRKISVWDFFTKAPDYSMQAETTESE